MGKTIREMLKIEPAKKPIAPVERPVAKPLDIRADEYIIVRKSDGANMCTLLLGEHGAGTSTHQLRHCNPQIALELRNILEQESRGNVTLGKYGA